MKLNKLFTQGLKTIQEIDARYEDYIRQLGGYKGYDLSSLREWERNLIKQTCFKAIAQLDTMTEFLYDMTENNVSSKRQYQFVYDKQKDIRASYVRLINEFNRLGL